ncbi:MAG TPA: hypothetical protein VFG53_15295 [Anaeromyxobacter sp.]|nr:hypothetical protein [Anaeromyxobacter sp.]
MNALELWVYRRLKNNPAAKKLVVDAYRALLSLMPQRAIVTSFPYKERRGFFYGFHDKSPFSRDGERLLAHRNLIGDRIVRAGDPAEVGFFEGADWSEYHPIGRTQGWNWQLGSMLQWMGGRGDRIVHNDIRNGRQVSIVRDLSGRQCAELLHPVVHVTSDGALALSYDFFRVETAMPGYGAVVETATPGAGADGDFIIFDCASGTTRFQFSLAEAASIRPHASMDGAFHFFHHALFNPSNTRTFVLHRWLDRKKRLWTRMFSVGTRGEDLYLFPMDEMISHVTWVSESEIFGYLRYPASGDGYYQLTDRTGGCRRFFAGVLNSDGHPTFDVRRSIVVTDTYPNGFGNQFLILGLPEHDRTIHLCRTHLPGFLREELRVDLHPRLHPERYIVCFDAGHRRTRSLLTLDFSEAIR